jgi:cobalt-zinc-cadmium efflux system outer membrane protein
MFRASIVLIAAIAAILLPRAARAGDLVLDYPSTLRLAAEHAPAVVAARGRMAETRGKRAGAAVRFTTNPDIEIGAGPRLIAGDSSTDFDVGLGQAFELGGRRGARIADADAEIAQSAADADDVRRLVRRDAALAFVDVLAADERLRLARGVEQVAGDLVAASEKRLAKGDAVELEVNLAKTVLGRARAAVQAAEADREAALGALRALLGLDPTQAIVVKGDLTARRAYDLDALLASARQRPDLRRLDAERDEGTALVRLGDSAAWPDVRVGLSYAHEENADILLGSLSITLPWFDRGQEPKAVGRAKVARAGAEKAGRARAIEAEVRAAFAAYQKRVAAVDEFEKNVLPLVDENDRLLTRSYEAGQLTLADYLVARRELIDARVEYLKRLVEMANAAAVLEAAAGVEP